MILATGNRHKLAELRTLLADLPLRLVGPDDLPRAKRFEPAEETGETFVENARIKARHVHEVLGGASWVVADDSGIEAAALGGVPGVRSARYAGEAATDEQNLAKLIGALDGCSTAASATSRSWSPSRRAAPR